MKKRDIQGIATKLGISIEQYISNRELGLKRCGMCKKWHEEKCFYKNKHTADGFNHICSICSNKVTNTYRNKNKKRLSAQRKMRRQSVVGKFQAYREKACARNIGFDLSFDEFQSFWKKPCSYCGSNIETIGIDRIDNNKGYNLDNCTACCSLCNKMKIHYDKSFWFEHMKKILKYKGVI